MDRIRPPNVHWQSPALLRPGGQCPTWYPWHKIRLPRMRIRRNWRVIYWHLWIRCLISSKFYNVWRACIWLIFSHFLFLLCLIPPPSPPLPVFLIRFAWCFRDPVNTEEVTDYLDVVTDPIDLRTIEKRIRKGDWYKNKHMLYSDMMKMVNNCKLYNGEGST